MQTDYQEKLLDRLHIRSRLSLRDAMELLDVSESTARRIFSRMEEDGLVIRTHGGIQKPGHTFTGYSFDTGREENIEKKQAIGREAVKLVDDGDVIFCDSGTTIQCMCAELAGRLRREKISVSIYTNSLANLDILSGVTEVTLIGGKFRRNRRDFCGYLAEEVVSKVHFSKVFVGADGCSGEKVFTTTDMETARMNQIVLENTDHAFMLTDSSKFFKVSHVLYAPAKQFDTVITDEGIDPGILMRLKEQSRTVIVAAVSQETAG